MPRVDYRVVVMAYISFIVLGIPGAVLGLLWSPHIQNDFNQPLSALGLLLVTAPIGYFVASVISGRLFARYAVGKMLAVGAFISAAGFVTYLVSPNWEIIAALGFIAGFGGGILDSGMNIYFAAHFDARLMNWLHAAFGIGTFIAPQLVNGVVLTLGMDWRVVYIIIIVAYIGIGLMFLATRQRWLPVSQPETQQAAAPLGSTLRLGVVWMGIIIFLLYAGSEATPGTWAAPLFKARGQEELDANHWVAAYWLSFTAGRIIFGAFVTYFRPENLVRGCFAGMVVGAALLWWTPFPYADLLGIVVFGFMLSPIFAILITATQHRLGPVHAPNAIGVQVAAASVGIGIVPALAGWMAEVAGLEVLPRFLLVLALVMLFVYQLSLIFSVDRKKKEAVEHGYAGSAD
jgi:fucose permease